MDDDDEDEDDDDEADELTGLRANADVSCCNLTVPAVGRSITAKWAWPNMLIRS